MIKIICIGKIKEKYLIEAISDYMKRISKYSKLEIIELSNYNCDNIKTVLEHEKELIFNYIKEKDYIVTLEIEGKMITSEEFSKKIIGGSYGLHQQVKDRSNYRLSFSKMTFPHKLFRLLLLEQIYRSFKIKNNETYHK